MNHYDYYDDDPICCAVHPPAFAALRAARDVSGESGSTAATLGSTVPVTTDQEAVSTTTDEPSSSALTGRVEVL